MTCPSCFYPLDPKADTLTCPNCLTPLAVQDGEIVLDVATEPSGYVKEEE
jgi:hypothetical protein